MSSYLYRLDVTWPPGWDGEPPAAVVLALSGLRAPFQAEFAIRGSAYRMRAFWRDLGAAAEVVRSNPVTWPGEGQDCSEKERVA